MAKSQKTSGVQAIERGCSVLDLLGSGKQSYSLRVLSNELSMPKPTVHRILSTFCRLGYVLQDDLTKEYRLGFRLVELGQVVLGGIQLRREAQQFLHKLASQVQETVHLTRLDRNEIVYLDKVERVNDAKGLRMASRVGMRNYAHSCAVGKVLLAFLSHNERDEILSVKGLPRLTKNTIIDRARFEAHLTEVREKGFAVDNEENEEGIRCVAAPVRKDHGKVVAAISISAPAFRMTKKRIEKELQEAVVKTAMDISKKLGFKDTKPLERR
jgi:DNA-binding IclR family transcriptional regulator